MNSQAGYSHAQTGIGEAALCQLALGLCGTPAYLYQQDPGAISLTRLPDGFTPALAGRAFGPQAEVRWERDTGALDAYTVLVLSELPQTLPGVWRTQEYEAIAQQIYLLGAWQPEEQAWIEVRLPHPLAYPLTGPDNAMARLTASALEYRLEGMVQYTRFAGLQVKSLQQHQEARNG